MKKLSRKARMWRENLSDLPESLLEEVVNAINAKEAVSAEGEARK